MKKIITITIIGVLLISGIGAVGLPTLNELKQSNISETIYFSEPITDENDEFQTLKMKNTNSWINIPNQPMIPAFIKTYTFPFGTKIKDVKVTFSKIFEEVLSKPIIPTSQPAILSNEKNQEIKLQKH